MASNTETPTGDPLERISLQSIPRPTKLYHSKPYERIALENTGFEGKGKTIFITGGATGVGFSISKAFAAAGVAQLVLMSRSPAPLAKAKAELESQFPSLTVTTVQASIGDHARTAAALAAAAPVDVLVHSATASTAFADALSVPLGDLQTVVDTNIVAPYSMLAAYLRDEAACYRGRPKTFINISSAAAHLRIPEQIGYALSKSAFAVTVEFLAAQQSAKPDPASRARLFNVHPGAFYTELASKYVSESAMEWEDIALPGAYAVWLAGPQSDFLHGRFLWPHWDVDELVGLKDRIEKDPSFLTLTLVL